MSGAAVARLTAVAAVLLAGATGVFYAIRTPEPAAPAPVGEAPKSLQLYCQFYVFTEQRPRLALQFEVGSKDGAPVFSQLYLAEDNGARTDYDGKETPRPQWAYDPGVEPKRITSSIKIPDSSQSGFHDEDIAIELYGYQPERDLRAFFEASLKNIHFQNLPGKCRQSRE